MSVFAFAAFIELLSIIPLFKVPNLPIAEKRPHGAFGARWQGFSCIFANDGWTRGRLPVSRLVGDAV